MAYIVGWKANRVGDNFSQQSGNYPVGSRVGGYLLEEQIGQGGMAVVFRARDDRLDRQVALKILAPALAADEAFRHRFIRESRMAAAVDDPHIIPVYDAGGADGALFIAMRYVAGGDVRSLLHREGTLSPTRVCAIISPVASALDTAHAAGLVHRDVKPANMLLDTSPGRPDHVYLSDFGLSKEALGATGLTTANQFLGTVDYAAPEQASGQAVGGQADQYALGCAAFPHGQRRWPSSSFRPVGPTAPPRGQGTILRSISRGRNPGLTWRSPGAGSPGRARSARGSSSMPCTPRTCPAISESPFTRSVTVATTPPCGSSPKSTTGC